MKWKNITTSLSNKISSLGSHVVDVEFAAGHGFWSGQTSAWFAVWRQLVVPNYLQAMELFPQTEKKAQSITMAFSGAEVVFILRWI